MSEEQKEDMKSVLKGIIILAIITLLFGPNFWEASNIDKDEFVKTAQQGGGLLTYFLARTFKLV